jgi:carbonic anhydrase/SulP family sulfate permease
VLFDAQSTDYIDPDVLSVIRDFRDQAAPARGMEVSLVGFRDKYQLEDHIQYVDYSTRELQCSVTPGQVLQILKEGNERFRTGRRLTRDFGRQIQGTATAQHPLAVVLSCVDSRAPAELIFDLGLGDILSVRVAGNVSSRKVLGSIEYGCAVAGAKLVLVMGHTRCGAVTAAVNAACTSEPVAQTTGCQHVEHVLQEIQESIDLNVCRRVPRISPEEREEFIDNVARRNVVRTVAAICEQSQTISRLVKEGRIALVGALYDVSSGNIEYLVDDCAAPAREMMSNELA